MQFFPIILLLLMSQCTPRSERNLNNAIESYINGEKGAFDKIENALLMKIKELEISDKCVVANKRILYTTDDTGITILYPFSKKFKIPNSGSLKYISATESSAVYSDGSFVGIIDRKGFPRGKAIYKKKDAIKAVWSGNGQVAFYADGKILMYDFQSESVNAFVKDQFPSPYPKHYNVFISQKDAYLCIFAGVAGSYNFSMINLQSKKILLKNLSSSSSRFSINGDKVFFLEGSTGQWHLIGFDFIKKTKKKMATFKKLDDIQIFPEGYIYKNSSEIKVARYNEDELTIPFEYAFYESLDDRFIISFKKQRYLVSFRRLFDEMNRLMQKIPGFTKKQ